MSIGSEMREDEDGLSSIALEKIDPILAIPFEIANSAPCIGLRWKGDVLVVGAPELVTEELKPSLAKLGFEIELIEMPESEVRDILSLVLTATGESILEDFATISGDAPISLLVDQLIERAVTNRASDLHIEPFENIINVRMRVDGRLRLLAELPTNLGAAISSRIKVLAQLNIVERRRPQDGQFTSHVGDRRIDIRVATASTIFGEKIVMRLHDERRPLVNLLQLGMKQAQLEPFSRSINAVNGLILAAGPTGSGKTTTLHSALRAASAPHKNVTTIEDPVEYVVPGLNQIPVLEASGGGFAVQLRAILRQDPDVILVGETRDAETARISVQAALTGHLVLSSIHATDAVGAVYRLMQMDIEPYLVASALKTVVSQRLVRRNCKYCLEEYTPTKSEQLILESFKSEVKVLARGMGCTYCGGSGYRDRIAAYQLLDVTENLAELISSRPDPVVFRKMALQEGMTSIATQAMELAVEGVTTLAEALELKEYD